jgi:hypothetical protein
MRQEFLLLADGAESVNGKIHILGGGIDRVQLVEFPGLAFVSIACSYLVGWNETNRTYAVAIRIASADEPERTIQTIEFETQTGRPPGAIPGQELRTLIAIRGPFRFDLPGSYKLIMDLNGQPQEPPFRFTVDRLVVPGMPAASQPPRRSR